jgi:pimeloyl-ACP methyl ester carboxylesterase
MTFRRQVSGSIEYLERSSEGGPVVVLLHGIGSGAASFAPLISHLPLHWRVIAWNAPGYGESEPLADEWPLAADYAAALKGFLDRLAIDRVFLVCHSLGCLMGAAFAVAQGDRVERLLLGSPALGHGVARGGVLTPAAQVRIDELERMGPETFAAARATRLVFQPEANPEIVDRVRQGMARVRAPGYPQAARMLASGMLLADTERLRVTTDVVVGAEDVVTPPEGARRVHEALRPAERGRLILAPLVGHAIYQQAPDAFASALKTLVQPG